MKKICAGGLSVFLVLNFQLAAQDTVHKSVHQLESEYYRAHPEEIQKSSVPELAKRADLLGVNSMSAVVYGFHPYWVSDASASGYYYSMLSHIAYFDAKVDNSTSTTGGFSDVSSWATTKVVDYARKYGKKIHLTITMFDYHERVLANAAYRQNLINNIIKQVNLRSADGVNIDFEGFATSQAENFSTFIFDLGTALKAQNKELAICLPAVDWSGVKFNSAFFSRNNPVVDYYFLMAYDYYWKGSDNAGPVAPLTTGTAIRHITRSIDYYLSAGATQERLIAGLPYYGFDWPVVSNARMAAATANGVSKTYTAAKTAIASIPSTDKFFDTQYSTPWYRYQSGAQWHQVWYDDSLSLYKKYEAIKSRGIAGTGMWALSYDGSNTELWGALKEAFASKSDAAYTNLSDFEYSKGTFTSTPAYSGSTTGIAITSNTSKDGTCAKNGYSSLRVVLNDNASVSSDWFVRLLSGLGNPANNVRMPSNSSVGLWLRTATAPSGATVSVTIDDSAGTEISEKIPVINDGEWHLYQWKFHNTGWSSYAGGNGIIDASQVTLDAVVFTAPDKSPEWTINMDDLNYKAEPNVPVELISFSAGVNGDQVQLKWKTATELNTERFDVQRRTDDGLFSSIASVASAGNSTQPREYSFSEAGLKQGRYHYRLKIVDLDGSVEYSGEALADVGVPAEFALSQNYPNPFNPSTAVRYTIPADAFVKLELFSVTGQRIGVLREGNEKAGTYSLQIDGSSLPSGIYFLNMNAASAAENFAKTIKLSLIK